MKGRRRSRSASVLSGLRVGRMPVNVYRLRSQLGPIGATIVFALILLLGLGERSGWFRHEMAGGDWDTYNDKKFIVTRVVDGDTLHVGHPDGEHQTTVVRFWGIDTPELRHRPTDPPDEPLAWEARQRVMDLAMGQDVTLRLENHRLRDKYGRLLAYIILPDGRSLNEIMVEEGLAIADQRFSHRLINEYTQLQKEARRKHVGLWGGIPMKPGELKKAGVTAPIPKTHAPIHAPLPAPAGAAG